MAVLRNAQNVLKQSPSDENAASLQEAKDNANKVIAQEKQKAWRDFVGTLNPHDSSSKVWSTLRAMDGRRRVALPDKPLRKTVGGKEANTDIKKAELACAVYAEVSRVKIKREDSKAAYGVIFGHIKQNESPDAAVPFTEAELSAVLRRSKGKAAGLDEVLPDQLHHLPPCGRSALLDLLNRAWSEVRIPASWKTALIVPIPVSYTHLTLPTTPYV